MASEDEDYSMYSEEEESYYYTSGEDESDSNNKHYKILKEEDIKQAQENHISQVSDVLSVSKGLACAFLCQKNWNLSSVYDEWASEKVLEPSTVSPATKSGKQDCRICFEKTRKKDMLSGPCGHPFCSGCWKLYVANSVNDGPGCLTLTCPDPDCKSVVGMDFVATLASVEDMDKYYRYLRRSYVECAGRGRKWCPAPGCGFAIEFYFHFGGDGSGSYDVTCDCSHKFCFNCTVDSHRPVDCKTAADWLEKNSVEAENTKWILTHTKPCPKCRRPINKNLGCNHMICGKPCSFHFCWVCLEPWKSHLESYYACNIYREEDVGGTNDGRDNAKKYLERYTHYFERWEANESGRKKAVVDLDRVRNERVGAIVSLQGSTQGQTKFLTEAWEQIVECRSVLKWSYTYGYYLSMKDAKKKMELFDYLQGLAESALEGLHHCVETEMDKYAYSRRSDFEDFREKLVGLTTATKNYFENFVRALENDLSEVDGSV